jgi:hypothetical protein
MSVKEVYIRPDGFDYDLPVKLVYQSLGKEDLINIAGDYPYIFGAIITLNNKDQLVFGGGEARKHEDFLQAMREDMENGNKKLVYSQYDLAQIDVNHGKIPLIKFAWCGEIDEMENPKRPSLIFRSIDPKIFNPETNILYANTVLYHHESASGKLIRKERV